MEEQINRLRAMEASSASSASSTSPNSLSVNGASANQQASERAASSSGPGQGAQFKRDIFAFSFNKKNRMRFHFACVSWLNQSLCGPFLVWGICGRQFKMGPNKPPDKGLELNF